MTIYTNDCYGFALPPQVDTVTFYYIDVQEPSGINAFEAGNIFSLGKIFPNPVMSEVTIPFYLPARAGVTISILNLEGKICFEKSMTEKGGYNFETFNVSMLNEGSYFIQVESNGRKLFGKLQVQKK